MNDAAPERGHDRLGSVARAKLLEYVHDVHFHGRLGPADLLGDLLVLQSLRDELEYRALPLRELDPRDEFRQPPRDDVRKDPPVTMDGAYCLRDLVA